MTPAEAQALEKAARNRDFRQQQRLAAMFGIELEEPEPETEEEEAEAIAREHARLEAFLKSRARN